MKIKKKKEQYKKDLNDPDADDAVITHLESDILQCEVKCSLGNITMNKSSRGVGIPAKPFQILKDNVVKVLNSICQQIWKTAVATGLEKISFHSNPKERQCKKCSNYCTIITEIYQCQLLVTKILMGKILAFAYG